MNRFHLKGICAMVFFSLYCGALFADNWKASANATGITGAIVPNSAATDLGIGITSAPTWKMEIKSESATGNGGTYKVLKLSTAATSNQNITLSASPTSGNYFVISSAAGAGFVFSTGAEGTSGIGTERIRILSSSGNVGIGTTNPGTYKLAVEGKIGAREVVVTTNAWADHVLKEDYKLEKLDDVEAYIKKNGCLPGIQTEKEAKANGVALGELQVKLLTKIEELTLHLISQDKRIKELEKKNEMLLEKVNAKK